ncbi:MAG: hypothetical protein ACK4UU_04780 [Fimbriimonadales bacterium]
MALLSVVRARGREYLHAWWNEYYLDNPLVWALQRQARWLPHGKTNLPLACVLPLWTRARTLWAVFWWTIAPLCIWIMYLDPNLKHQAQSWLEMHLHRIIGTGFGFLAGLRIGSMVDLLDTMHKAKQLTAIGMTRLRGAHLVYGSVLDSWLRGTLMRTLIAYFPLLWAVHSTLGDSALIALGTAAVGVLAWNGITLAFLLMSFFLIPEEPSVREASAGNKSSRFDTPIRILQILGLMIVPISLMLIVFMPLEYRLLLLTPVAWAVALLSHAPAVRRAERILRCKEAEIVPSEGRWQ